MDLKSPEFTRKFFQTDNATKDSEDTIHTTVFTVSKLAITQVSFKFANSRIIIQENVAIEAYRISFHCIATVEQLQLEYTHEMLVIFVALFSNFCSYHSNYI